MTAKEIDTCEADLGEFLKNNGYEVLFTNHTKSVFHHAVSYMKGLISLPRGSNMSKISENVIENGTCRDFSHFITSSPWSSEKVMKLTRSHVIDLLGPGGSVFFMRQVNKSMGPFLLEHPSSILEKPDIPVPHRSLILNSDS